MADQHRIRKGGKLVYVKEATYDPNPLYCPHHPAAFDPRYGPESEGQIEWHIKHGTPGAEKWEVGEPAKPYA